ncbi:MAG: hypothetical protein L0210_13335 [Rhodospirillales bacterium]|nr:hypothetical protein [Rhodospirillales bacterium]
MRDLSLDRWQTAYHEAGHAVMALYCGIMPNRAVIASGSAGGNAGWVSYRCDPEPEQRIKMLLAGRFGEILLCRLPGGEKAWMHEIYKSIDIAQNLFPGNRPAATELHHRCFEECQRLFQDHFFVGAVNNFAVRLHQYGELRGNQLIEACGVSLRLIRPDFRWAHLVSLQGFSSAVESVSRLPPQIRKAFLVRRCKIAALVLGIGMPLLLLLIELHEYALMH